MVLLTILDFTWYVLLNSGIDEYLEVLHEKSEYIEWEITLTTLPKSYHSLWILKKKVTTLILTKQKEIFKI